jgi:hypothetical protein
MRRMRRMDRVFRVFRMLGLLLGLVRHIDLRDLGVANLTRPDSR